ncbi:secreted frizzled-related protein 1-like [Paramormyrops kingsleyae]|uniref:Secreted frizzled-related protein 1 n=1 Tax=Paramormyrops kingsleyae TaxID=1676925 RepID=A0A3B3QGZ4_9TELE|nr:secreted frizzled-related protein 1-like [Paramormyrops kingsleyae]
MECSSLLLRRPAVLIQVLVLTLGITCTQTSEEEFITWKSYNPPTYGKKPQCIDIPSDLKLCHNVGYNQMLLPNLLEHETLAEVKQQAGSWVPLVHKGCHPGTQVFLCSLFAPVCLDHSVMPCRWLCEAVRDSCTPIMEAFGFPWPEMLSCSQFPKDEEMCIAMSRANATDTSGSAATEPVCPPCDNQLKMDIILEHVCASEFAIKTKVKEVKLENSDRKVILHKKKKVLKLGSLNRKDLKNLVLYLKNGADCPCQQLDHLTNNYLIMGRKVDKKYLLTSIQKWEKSSKELKKAMKRLNTHKCPVFETVFK